jgi:hypothetical protein
MNSANMSEASNAMGSATFSVMTLRTMTLSMMTFSKMTLHIMTLSKMTISVMTNSTKSLFVTLSTIDTQHNSFLHHYAESHYPECHIF